MKIVDIAFLITVSVSSILALSIIVVPIFASLPDANGMSPTYSIPKIVEDWGGTVVGFYFGSMLSVFLKYFENRDTQTAEIVRAALAAREAEEK